MTSKLQSLPGRLRDLFRDLRLGIVTRGRSGLRTEEIGHYATISYRFVEMILDRLNLRADDGFVDLGSGKGRVVCSAARRSIRTAIGVDISAPLCAIARTNAAALRGRRSSIDILEIEAQKFDYDRGTVFYLFDPFGPQTVREVLARLTDSLRRNPRHVRIAYANPRCESVFKECPALVEFDRWLPAERGIGHTVIFYESARAPA